MKNICVIGLGYIGLPTACTAANNGYNVLGIDTNNEIIKKLNSGKIHIDEPELENIFIKAFNSKKIRISKNVEESDVFIITVPTPLDDQKKADLSYIVNAVISIKDYIRKNNLVILESTSPPGTTRNIVGKLIFKETGLRAGEDYYLAFCPERVLPGKIIYELINNDRMIGGINKKSAEEAKEIYSSFVKGRMILTDLETAEFTKLAENTYRDVNIAFSNELSLICSDYNINVWDIIKFANMHPRVNILSPGPGVGGHCIPIDPWFILNNFNRKNTLIEKCRYINSSLPDIVSKRIIEIVIDKEDPKVTLFGASYKENIGDTRESPTKVIYKNLLKEKVNTSIYDPLSVNFEYSLSPYLEDSLKDSDLLVLLVGHKIFKKISLKYISNLMRTKNIFDTRNFFKKEEANRYGFKYYII
ncbi:MAG: nucleotide sugar dehydrogenase [Parcubacteria group bacterium]|nr:nucleotide sugar dehydrogenase [Parcubacteria group bacterium]